MIRNWILPTAPFHIQAIRLVLILVVILGILFYNVTQPSNRTYDPSQTVSVRQDALRQHVDMLAVECHPRSHKFVRNLDKSAAYISAAFTSAGAEVSEQVYRVKGRTYRNVMAEFGPETESRIVVGAHYDTCQDTPGADDNASGVAGLIELGRLLGQSELNKRFELVAYTLEEPPHFRSANMGSAQHAYRHRKNGEDIELMVALEMIGFFSDEPGSQNFPSMLLRLFYPDTGNFISIIGSYGERKYVREFKAAMRGATDLPVHSMCATRATPMITFSDHSSYWNQGYPALMITDTAFMRNLRYHQLSDLPDTLDYDAMAKVVIGVFEALMRLDQTQ